MAIAKKKSVLILDWVASHRKGSLYCSAKEEAFGKLAGLGNINRARERGGAVFRTKTYVQRRLRFSLARS